MWILFLFVLMIFIIMILLPIWFILRKGALKVSICFIIFGIFFIYCNYIIYGGLMSFGCDMGNVRCSLTWTQVIQWIKKGDWSGDAGNFLKITSIGVLYIITGVVAFIYKSIISLKNKKHN